MGAVGVVGAVEAMEAMGAVEVADPAGAAGAVGTVGAMKAAGGMETAGAVETMGAVGAIEAMVASPIDAHVGVSCVEQPECRVCGVISTTERLRCFRTIKLLREIEHIAVHRFVARNAALATLKTMIQRGNAFIRGVRRLPPATWSSCASTCRPTSRVKRRPHGSK